MSIPLAILPGGVWVILGALLTAGALLVLLAWRSGGLRVLRAECGRLVGSRAAICAGFLALLLPVAKIFVSALVERAERALGNSAMEDMTSGTGWRMLMDGWAVGLVLAMAFILVQAARSISGDRETGVLRLAVTRSASRTGAVLGRALLGPIMVVALVILSGLGSWFATKFIGRGDFGNISFFDDPTFGEDGLGYIQTELARGMTTVVLGLCSIHAFGLLVSSLIRGPVIALAVSTIFLLIWAVLRDSFGDDQWFIFASHGPTAADGSAMSEMMSLAEGNSDAYFSQQAFTTGLIFPVAEGLLFVALSCLAVRSRSI